MNKFERVYPTKRQKRKSVNAIVKSGMISKAQAKKLVNQGSLGKTYQNDKYQVIIRELVPNEGLYSLPPMVHLSIKRNDQLPVCNWRDFQIIKNELVGEECEGIEVYPAESRKVDTCNQYHLWVFKDPKDRLPIGFEDRLIINDSVPGLTKQESPK